MKDKDLELVLPEAATLTDLDSALLMGERLPELWGGEELPVSQLYAYFQGDHAINVDKGGGYQEPVFIPKAEQPVVDAAIQEAVTAGKLWLIHAPASLLGEPIPTGVLTADAVLRPPPPPINVLELLPAALPGAWANGQATVEAVAQALSQKLGQPLPWKTVCAAINGALQASYLEVTGTWPGERAVAAQVTLREKKAAPLKASSAVDYVQKPAYDTQIIDAEIELAIHEVQELGEIMPELQEWQATHPCPVRIFVRVECGDGKTALTDDLLGQINAMLAKVKETWQLKK
jgi:hypothetical protein